jgi:hypothetical protein
MDPIHEGFTLYTALQGFIIGVLVLCAFLWVYVLKEDD